MRHDDPRGRLGNTDSHQTMPTFDEVRARWNWQPIPHCPGRYVLRAATRTLALEEIAGDKVLVREFQVAGTPDAVLVTRLEGGGLISFRKADGVIVHTLNTPEGLERRLARLEISASDIE